MESRIANVQSRNRDHSRAMIASARSCGSNERVFRKCVGELHFRQLFAERGIDPFDAVLVDDERLPEQFRRRRCPQTVDQLSQRRRLVDP